ncbi:MAG: glycosyl hydrolase [Myxococcaceae bacterium]|nr:glycosyl hydrolase [Myxococcaceae bacterium]
MPRPSSQLRWPLWLFWVFALGCRQGHAESSAAPAAPRTGPLKVAETAYKQGTQDGWMDFGWSARKENPQGPALMNLADYGGWILVRTQPTASAGGVVFHVKAPADWGDFLEVRLDLNGANAKIFPRVKVQGNHKRALKDGFIEVFVPMEELNPKQSTFDRIVIFAYKKVDSDWVALDNVALTVAGPVVPKVATAKGSLNLSVQCKQRSHKISPLIYGIALYPWKDSESPHQFKMGATARRWGGNHASRYNWKLGDAWNVASDYFFKNVSLLKPGQTYDNFLQDDLEHHMASAVVMPMVGWVAKDTTSFSFPVSMYGPQADSEQASGAGNGLSPDGKELPSPKPTQTSVAAPPEFIGEWVKAIREKDAKGRGRSVQQYILDNEPGLWHVTHRDVHPERLSYDELLKKTIAYGTAIRKADPEASIAGPAEWGWSNYLYSSVDLKAGTLARPDRRAHADEPLTAWYLKKLYEHQKATGVKVLDVLDLHFYPQASGVGIAESGETSPEKAALRIRTTRALWDPTYRDESWIAEPVMLIPRMKKWIIENYPGLGTSIGEWNFGAENHMSGGLATAEALGRFGEQNLTSAFYWAYPPNQSPAFYAFHAFRNYDGKGGHFQDWSLKTNVPKEAPVSLFASSSEDGKKVVAVVLNLDPDSAFDANVKLDGCDAPTARRVFTYSGEPTGFGWANLEGVQSAVKMKPYSINVVEWTFEK